VKSEILSSYIYIYMDLSLATLKAVSFYFQHNVSTLNKCRKLSCGTVVCKHFASHQGYPKYRWDLIWYARVKQDAPPHHSPDCTFSFAHANKTKCCYRRCAVGFMTDPQRFRGWICLRLRVEIEHGEPTRMDPL
jgi:hypothetical protein